MPLARPTAAILLIGDELLSGKIRDSNGWFLSQRLRARGIALVEICTVGDDPRRIGTSLLRLLELTPIVFTSGGVGPTHDDRTLAAIAEATGRPLERNADLENTLRAYYKDDLTEAALNMADIPRGTVLRALPGWPVLRLDLERSGARGRVYILPGVPPLLRAKIETLEAIDGELPRGPAWSVATVHLSVDEAHLAPHLDAVVSSHPDVSIGSYPRWARDAAGARTITVRVTFDATDDRSAQAAKRALTDRLPSTAILADDPEGEPDPEAPGLE